MAKEQINIQAFSWPFIPQKVQMVEVLQYLFKLRLLRNTSKTAFKCRTCAKIDQSARPEVSQKSL